jgi:hypothetical protein
MFKKLSGLLAGSPRPAPASAADAARARAKARTASAVPSGTPVAPPQDAAEPPHPGEAALLHAIAERLPTDPLIGAKLGGKEINTERGVHAESLLTALGALAGYACQASVRAAAVASGLPETAGLITVEANGQKFFFGDVLNKPLAESAHSVWAFAAGAAQEAGCASLLDFKEIFAHVAKSVGGDDFGKPRVTGHAAQDTPLNFVRALWPALLPLVKKYCPDPERWPALYAVAVYDAIMAARGTLDPCLALRIVMESAIPMSKIDLGAS